MYANGICYVLPPSHPSFGGLCPCGSTVTRYLLSTSFAHYRTPTRFLVSLRWLARSHHDVPRYVILSCDMLFWLIDWRIYHKNLMHVEKQALRTSMQNNYLRCESVKMSDPQSPPRSPRYPKVSSDTPPHTLLNIFILNVVTHNILIFKEFSEYIIRSSILWFHEQVVSELFRDSIVSTM